MKIAYERGLHELGDGLYAYLQPDGGWGWSNAGLVTAEGTSLLVDTLFDLNLTRDMLDAMQPVTDGNPIGQAFNTHGNGDHWFGNSLLPDGIPIVASAAAIEDMRAAPAAAVNVLFNELDLGRNSTRSPSARCASSTSPRWSSGCRPSRSKVGTTFGSAIATST